MPTLAGAAGAALSASACDLAAAGELDALRQLPLSALLLTDKNGHTAAHWAAGSGQLPALEWLIAAGLEADGVGRVSTRSKRRRPLHFAARNGQLEVVRHLCEVAGADPDSRDSQEVSPFQLAVWQNWLEVAQYLVERHGVDPKQLNVFACGAQHWLGTTPCERAGPEGVELLPTARWLRGYGVDFHAVQRQGHSPLHKASWGGHLAFCRWLRDECGLLDDAQDRGGNYAADVADMGGHVALAAWLRAEGSGARARSLAVLARVQHKPEMAVSDWPRAVGCP
jgi:ankyrin repeat protein